MERNLSQIKLTLLLAGLTAKRVLRRKSSWGLLMIGLFPCMVVFFWILQQVVPDLRGVLTPYGLFRNIQSVYFLNFFVPLVAIFLGLGVISDEIETRNITFTLVRPLQRRAIVVGRFLGHLVAAVFLVWIALGVNYLANMLFQVESFFEVMPHLLNGLFVLGFGMAAYLAIVALLGAIGKKFAILGSILWMVFDTVFSMMPVNSLKAVSIKYRMQASYWDTLPQYFPSFTTIEQSAASLNALWCMGFTAVACMLIALRLGSFEIVLSEGAS